MSRVACDRGRQTAFEEPTWLGAQCIPGSKKVGRALRLVLRALGATLLLANASCGQYNEGDYVTDPTSVIRELRVSPRTLPADGASTALITVVLQSDAPNDRRLVSLTTTAGTFAEGTANTATITANQGGEATAMLRAPSDSGLAFLRATAIGVTRQDTIRFVRAYPERVDIEPQRFSARALPTEEVGITITLRRTVGRPTSGALVTLSATDSTGTVPVGRFGIIPPSDQSGGVSVRYAPTQTSYRGLVRIRAITNGESGKAVVGETAIDVIP